MGANLARRLLSGGHAVHLLVRPSHRAFRIEDLRGAVEVHEEGLDRVDALERLARRIQPRWIFHLAAHGGYPDQTGAEEIAATNVLGTMHVLEACLQAGFAAFVNAGSSSEYGYVDHAPAETERLEPNSTYAVTKAFGTHYCRSVAQRTGAPIATLRLYSVYGPWEEATRLVPTLISRGRRGELPPLVDPETARDFVHVEDVCEAFVLAAERPAAEAGAVYNVGTGRQTTVREAVDVACGVLGIAVKPAWGTLPARPWDTRVWVADPRKIERMLGWTARIGFEEGFRKTVAWAAERGAGTSAPGGS